MSLGSRGHGAEAPVCISRCRPERFVGPLCPLFAFLDPCVFRGLLFVTLKHSGFQKRTCGSYTSYPWSPPPPQQRTCTVQYFFAYSLFPRVLTRRLRPPAGTISKRINFQANVKRERTKMALTRWEDWPRWDPIWRDRFSRDWEDWPLDWPRPREVFDRVSFTYRMGLARLYLCKLVAQRLSSFWNM